MYSRNMSGSVVRAVEENRVRKATESMAKKAPRPGYPAYLLREFNGVLCETL